MATRDALGRFISETWSQSVDQSEMQWTVVSSSNVAAVGFNPGTNILGVTFHNGSTYMYHDVDESIYDAFITAPSPGKFMYQAIRDHYRYERVS